MASLKVPGLKKATHADKEVKEKIETMIKETLDINYINSYPIEHFNLQEIDLIAEYARENDLIMILKAERSNFHQGVLIQLVRKDCIEKFVKMGVL